MRSNYSDVAGAFEYFDFDVDRINQDEIWDQMIKRLKNSMDKETIDTIILLGHYGCGKTFLLHSLEKVLSGKIEEGKFDSNKIVCSRINLSPSELPTKIGLNFVTSIFKAIGLKKLEEISQKMELKDFSILDFEMKAIFQKLREKYEESKIAAFHWITGESVSKENTKLNMRTGLNSSEKALRYLNQFLTLLKAIGYESLVVLVDEFEYVVTVYSPSKVNQMMHMFRNIYDEFAESKTKELKPANLIFVIAITPTGWDDLTNLEKTSSILIKTGGAGVRPWLNRVNPVRGRNLFELKPFDEEETRELVTARLRKNRKEKNIPYDTFPFVTPPFIDLLYKKTKGIPKDILQLCDLVISIALERGLKEINAENGKEILETYRVF
ncbi:MAG: DUF2791 family P-loop domain-containing protein [Candidatus Bathyarchaeota archaeon]|nr:DUF2791 family P-loop domain-containing protein [Candidatus Bathyarchaeota archaeon]